MRESVTYQQCGRAVFCAVDGAHGRQPQADGRKLRCLFGLPAGNRYAALLTAGKQARAG